MLGREKQNSQMDKQIGEVQVKMRKLIEVEKQKSERFLSLARKYYGMWKRLTEKCQHKSAWKSQSSQAKDFKPNVSFDIFSSSGCTLFVFKSLDGWPYPEAIEFSGKDFMTAFRAYCMFWQK